MAPRRFVGAVTICSMLFASLSAAAQPAGSDPAGWRTFVEHAGPGATVAVSLKDGSRLRGAVVQVRDGDFSLTLHTRIPVPVRDVAFADVLSVEQTKPSWSPGRKVVTGAG